MFIKMSSIYFFFFCSITYLKKVLLILASQRVEALIIEILEMRGWLMKRQVLSNSGAVTQRGNTPSLVEWIIFSYIIGNFLNTKMLEKMNA